MKSLPWGQNAKRFFGVTPPSPPALPFPGRATPALDPHCRAELKLSHCNTKVKQDIVISISFNLTRRIGGFNNVWICLESSGFLFMNFLITLHRRIPELPTGWL